MDYILRDKCIISGEELEVLSNLKYPVFCGCVDKNDKNDLLADECIAISNKSGILQLKKLIPLNILYKNGHDSGAIGKIWEEHHSEFAKFIAKYDLKNILEIGGGHGKLSQNFLKLQSANWTIVEPNTKNKFDNVNYIDGFFDKNICKNKQYDAIIHSHTFEHIYNPDEFLRDIYNSLNGGGYMIFSIPNLKKYLENKWINFLSFEHTILLTENVIDYLLNKNNFNIIEKQYFKNHSIFYCVKKDNNINKKVNLKNEYNENKNLFLNMQNFYKDKIQYLNCVMKSYDEVYLFGAHIFSQYLIYRGLDISYINCVLDNNINKHNKRLYGTNLQVYSPSILANKKNKILVILCAGVYNEEIKNDILKHINSEIYFED